MKWPFQATTPKRFGNRQQYKTSGKQGITGTGNMFDPNRGPTINFASSNTNDVFRFGQDNPGNPGAGPSQPPRLRPIVIDGQNVGVEHGKQANGNLKFSSLGVDICVDYFKRRGHKDVKVFLPGYIRRAGKCDNVAILDKLEKSRNLIFTPSREINGVYVASYDDRYVVQYAASNEGVIVSNDNYRDLLNEGPEMKKAIQERLLMFNFVGNMLMFPQDPLGQHGPNLDTFLSM
jgi:ribonuclease ZC3H12